MDQQLSFRSIVENVASRMILDFDLIAQHIPHKGEKGVGRENVLRLFLNEYLPERFGCSTGFVFDVKGQVSKQLDIIIYDKLVAPRLNLADKRIFPSECVVAVGEVKSQIKKRETLLSAFENLKSVKNLTRRGNISIGGGFTAGDLQRDSDTGSQIFGFVFTSTLLKEKSTINAWVQFVKKNEEARYLWPNLVGSLKDGVYYYWKLDGAGTKPSDSSPLEAKGIYHKKPKQPELSLLSFYMFLYNSIVSTAVAHPEVVDYLQERQPTSSKWSYFDLTGERRE